MSYEDIDFSKFFSSKNVFVYIQKKIQKLTSVLYVLTAYLPESEPIRLKVRQASLRLLENVSDEHVSEVGSTGVVQLSAPIIFLLSLLRVGRESGYITDMNQRLLEKELLEILTLLERHGSEVNSVPDLSLKDMEVESRDVFLPKKPFLNKSFNPKDNIDSLSTERFQAVATTPSFPRMKDVSQRFKSLNKKNIKRIDQFGRDEQIRSIISSLGEVSIRDITGQMPSVSSKTVQRALLTMVADGVLKKVGERRWSKYSLA